MMTNFLIELKIHVGGDKPLTVTGPVGICVTVKGGRNGTESVDLTGEQQKSQHKFTGNTAGQFENSSSKW